MTLEFTGERFVTECQGEMVYEHWHRYLLAREYAHGKRVLDIPGGEGYGSHLLAGVAESVVGIDISKEAVAHASEKYRKDNLQYIAASGTQMPLPDASFDFIVSFEMIEHIHEQEAFLREVNRLLKPDGVFLISSPNRPEYTDKTGYKNEFHVKELDKEELRQQLLQYWPNQIWFAQRAAFHSMIWPIDTIARKGWAMNEKGETGFPEPMYFIVFCAKNEPALANIEAPLTLVADKENSVYAEWSRTYRENAKSREEIEALRAQLAQSIPPRTTDAPVAPVAHEHWLVRLARKIAG
jgi:ubiquinone/menaquinone biosynthesis C-methylase UbiE